VAEETEEATRRVQRAAMSHGVEPQALWVAGAGIASLALYRSLAELGDLSVHLTAYLVIHAGLFAIYAGVVFLLARRVFTLPPWTARRAAPPLVIARRDSAASPAVVPQDTPPAPPRALEYPIPPPERRVPARSRVTPILLIAFAAGFRITLLFVPASLSPGTTPAIHPPLAEAVFGAAARAGLGEIGAKGILVLFDLATALALALLLRRLGRPLSLAALYLWNPLVVIEIAGGGHKGPLGILFLVLAALFIVGERRALGISSYAVSILARGVPVAFAPIFIRRFKIHHLLLGAGVLVVGALASSGGGGRMLPALAAQAVSADHNAVAFPAVRAGLEAVVPVETLERAVRRLGTKLDRPAWGETLARWVQPDLLARGVLCALLAGMILISIDVPEIQRELLCAAGLLLVLSPAVHPWYALWVVPFAAAEVSLPWLLFTGLVPLSYLSLRAPDGRVPMDVLAIEWGAPAVLALALGIRKRIVARRIRALAARA